MEKTQFEVDGIIFDANDIDWEYSLQEGDMLADLMMVQCIMM